LRRALGWVAASAGRGLSQITTGDSVITSNVPLKNLFVKPKENLLRRVVHFSQKVRAACTTFSSQADLVPGTLIQINA
jgi:hypothetical protein